jgi:hypothetical protein
VTRCCGCPRPSARHELARGDEDPNHWEGIAARYLLRRHLNANSLEDLAGLFDRFPRHVVEFSATAQGDGTCPNPNAVVWKVRDF